MEKSKKFKTLSVLILGVLCCVLSFGCSCSKKIKPTGITLDKTEVSLLVGQTVDVKYTIAPADSSNCKVDVVTSDPNTVTLNQTSFDAVEGTVTITAAIVNVSGVTITFKIADTDLSASIVVKVKPDPVKLAITSSLNFNSATNSIIFKNVPGTQKYVVDIDGVAHDVTDPSTSTTEHYIQLPVFNNDIPLELNQVHTIKVQAKGDNDAYSDGDYTTEYKFLKYAPVTGLVANNGVVTWDAHAVATEYSVKINDVVQTAVTTTNSFTLPATEAGEYLVQVAAVSNSLEDANGVKIFGSDFTESYKITKLANCVLTLDNEAIDENEVLTYSKVTFPEVLGATKYLVKITPQVGEHQEFETLTNFILIDDRFTVGTEYTIEITPIGELANTISAEPTSISFRRLGTIGEAQINNNILTIDGLPTASKYAVIVKSDTEQKYIVSEVTTIDLAEELPVAGTYRVFVRPIGMIAENVTMANGDLFDTNLVITKIVNPIVSAIKNDGTVQWNAIPNVASYSIYVNDNFVNSSTTNSYQIDTTQLEAGDHNVKVVAVGNGTTTISSGKANAVTYDFNKLPKLDVQTFGVENDILSFEGITEAYDYGVKFNDGNYRLIGKVEGKQSVIVSNVINGTNEIYVMAVGDDVKTISSSPTKYTVTRLDAPTNLRIENGVLLWNGTSGIKYHIYIGESDEYAETTEPNCDNLQGVAGELNVKVKALPTSGNYISSDFGTITVIKLPMVAEENVKVLSIADHNELSNYKLTWTSVENCTGYNVSIFTADMAEPDLYTGYQNTEINLSESYPAGVYTVKIVAVGNSTVDSVGYVNSSVTEIEYRKLAAPVALKVENNKLVWQDAAGDNPSGYKLAISYANREENFVTTQNKYYEFDFTQFNVDEKIKVRIRALGDNVGSVTSSYCDVFEFGRAQEISDLLVVKGEVRWVPLQDANARYFVYGTATPDDATSYTLLTTTTSIASDSRMACTISGIDVNKEYSIYVVASVDNMLYSDPSTTIKITKLPTVQNFGIANNVFSWDAVANATGYVVVDSMGNKKETTELSLDFSEFGYENNGDYSFRVYAVGTSNGPTGGYINSNVNTPLVVSILEAPNTLEIVDNKLVITNSRKHLPTKYRIEFVNDSLTSDNTFPLNDIVVGAPESATAPSITTIDLSSIALKGAGSYTISVYGIGNGSTLMDTALPLMVSAIEKLSNTALGEKVLNGEFVWTGIEGCTYDVYINNNLVIEDTSEKTINFTALKTAGKFEIQKNTNTIIQLVAQKQGLISSEKSEIFTVVKLPEVKKFAIMEDVLDPTIGASLYSFTWEDLVTSYSNQAYNTSKHLYSFEVVQKSGGTLISSEYIPTPDGETVEGNGTVVVLKTNDGHSTYLEFNYGAGVYGDFTFSIKANGTSNSGSAKYAFLNGDETENPIRVTILQALEVSEDVTAVYDRKTNTINLINPNNEGENRVNKIVVAYMESGTMNVLATDQLDKAATSYNLIYAEGMTPGKYDIFFGVVGDINNNILNPCVIQYQTLEILAPVTNVRTTKGYLDWTHEGGDGITYDIYIDGVKVTYEELVEIPPAEGETPEGEGETPSEPQYETIVHSTFKDQKTARLINDLISDTAKHVVTIKAVREPSEEGLITADSVVLENERLTIERLEGVANPNFINSMLFWSKVDNAEGYIIRCVNADMATLFGESYDAESDGILVNGVDMGSTGVSLPATMTEGTYGFYVASVGSTTESAAEPAYLTSGMNGTCSTTVLAAPTTIYTNGGIIGWTPASDAVKYKVEIYEGQTVEDGASCKSFESIERVLNMEDATYKSGFYTIYIYSLGDGSSSLDSSIKTPAKTVAYKAPIIGEELEPPEGEDVSPDYINFKVRDGYLSWSIPFTHSYIQHLTGGYNVDPNKFMLAAMGSPEADLFLANNLTIFRNMEVTIENRGKVLQNQTAFKIGYNAAQTEIIYYYDFNFTNIQNPYKIKVRLMGNTYGYTESEVLGMNDDNYSYQLFGEDDPEGGEPTDPEGGGGSVGVTVNYLLLNGNYSKTIEGVKLAPPQTPVAGTKTMIENDNLYFARVSSGSGGNETRYLIEANCLDEQKEDLQKIIEYANLPSYEIDLGNTGTPTSCYRVPISELGLDTGYPYVITVKALGTADSEALASGKTIYLTSNYNNMCEVEMLAAPELSVVDGNLSVSSIQSAVKQEIKIWSVELGGTYNEEIARQEPGSIAQTIVMTVNGAEEGSVHSNFATVDSGKFIYSFVDNGYFPAGSYYITSRAIGDGINKISSEDGPLNAMNQAEFKVHKFGEIDVINLAGGLYRWETVSYSVGGVPTLAASYLVSIYVNVVGNLRDGAVLAGTETVDLADVSEDNIYCYYDLDSAMYPAVNEAGERLEYMIKVSALGTINSAEASSSNYFVNSDSVDSAYYKRLLAPQEIKMVNGVLSWLEVEGGVEYEVYKYNEQMEETDEDYGYQLLTDDNYRLLTFSSDTFETNQIFTLRIRAIPGSLTGEYLNGEFCFEILTKRLEAPLLRIEDGVIKWNSTDLSYAIATGVKIKLVKLAENAGEVDRVIVDRDFDIAEEINSPIGYKLVGTDEELPAGQYRIEVSYLGSNREIIETNFGDEEDSDEEKPDDGSEDSEGGTEDSGEDTETPEGGSNEGTEGPEGGGTGENDPNEGTGEEGGENTDPEGGEENPDEGTEEEPIVPIDPIDDTKNYAWFSSKATQMTMTKLPTPSAELYIEVENDAPVNYISVAAVPNARYFEFTAVKYGENSEIIKTKTFDVYDIGTPAEYFKLLTVSPTEEYVLFNLKAISDYDALAPDQPNPFGQEFSVYCHIYGEDRLHTETGSGFYIMSNKSNEVAVEVPLTPTGLTVIDSTGLISWNNKTNNTKTKIRIYYNSSSTPVIYTVKEGVSTFKLQTMGTYSVSVLSYIEAANGIEISSAYTEPVSGKCEMFASGSGTQADPYLLSTSKHVVNIEYYQDKYFKFINNINMTNTDLSEAGVINYLIGRAEKSVFTGTIDGDGYRLTNVKFSLTTTNSIALIREIGATGVIKNLKVGINSSTGNYKAKEIAGITIENNGTIENVQTLPYSVAGSDGEILYTSSSNQQIAGIAIVNNGTISNCVNATQIKFVGAGTNSMDVSVAGIAIENKNGGKIINSANKANLYGTVVSGIVVENYSEIEKCLSVGNITAKAMSANVQVLAAGIAITNANDSTYGMGKITSCYAIINNFTVSGNADATQTNYIAGLVCEVSSTNTNTITASYVVIDTVTISGKNTFGSFVSLDDRLDSAVDASRYYVGCYFYEKSGTYTSMGEGTYTVATGYSGTDNTTLSTRVVSEHSGIYNVDTSGTINSGYPVFSWQLTNYDWKPVED